MKCLFSGKNIVVAFSIFSGKSLRLKVLYKNQLCHFPGKKIEVSIQTFIYLSRFQRRQEMDDFYLNLTVTGKCRTFVGRGYQPGSHIVEIGIGCVTHELMHALGFFHEHNRHDRDQHVKIHWENIIPGEDRNFEKHAKIEADTYGTPYDPCSVMHYPPRAFGFVRTNFGVKIQIMSSIVFRIGR